MGGFVDRGTTETPAVAETLRRTVAVVDMVGYSSIARMLEENISAASVLELNTQIQTFMRRALTTLPDQRAYSVLTTTGDGIIVMFERAEDAHSFAHQVHLLVKEHNDQRSESSAQRWFRVGIATGELSANADAALAGDYAGTTIANAVRLESAAAGGEIVIDNASFLELSEDAKRLYGAEETVKGKRDERFRARRYRVTGRTRYVRKFAPPKLLTRRTLLGSGAAVAGGAAVAAWLGLPAIERRMHPLPAKRFVAVLGWPVAADEQIGSAIAAAVDAIGSELARAEADDPNLFVISRHIGNEIKSMAQLNPIRESLGANLILAISGVVQPTSLGLTLSVIDPVTAGALRAETISTPVSDQLSLPAKAVRTAAELLDIRHYEPDYQRTTAGTSNPEAYAAFQAGKVLKDQPNDAGLDAAMEKYQQAIDLDSNYARAYAELAWSYCRYYYLHKNPSALTLAEGNCVRAIAIDPQLVAGHLAYAAVLGYRGDQDGAIRETAKALAIDPSDARTLVSQGELYTRLNRWTDGEDTFARVLKLRPNSWVAHQEFGFLYSNEAKYSKALDQFLAVTIEVPKRAIGFANVGAIYLQLGKLDDAINNVEKALALGPSSQIVSIKARALRAGAKYTEATEFAKKATDLNAEDSDAWLELGDCYSYMPGSQSEARAAYKKSASLQELELDTNPTDGPGWMSLALARIKSGSPLDAPALVEKAEKNWAGDIDSQLCKARILELLGKRDEAIATIRACLDRGATMFQIKTLTDMGSLLKDPRFEALATAPRV